MDSLPIYDIPWELVAASLQQELSAEEALQLQQWLSADKANQEKYDQLRQLWNNGLAGYTAYQSANETDAWLALQKKIAEKRYTPVISGRFNWLSSMKTRIAVAAVFILVIGTLFWYENRDTGQLRYATSANQQINITLPDGSTLLLKQSSEVLVADRYNTENRMVTMVKGEAFFNITHIPQLPFIVNMGTSTVKDIGTSFSIRKTADSIKVAVTSGKVAFIKNGTEESRELSAGMAVSFTMATLHFGEIESLPLEKAADSSQLLHFDNTPLSDVITVIQKVYNKRIELNGTQLAQKRFKADLQGQPFDRALQEICITLNLTYAEKDGVYILKEK